MENEIKNEQTRSALTNINNKEVISEDLAQQEVDKWLNAHKIRKTVREKNASYIATLTDAMIDGLLVLNEDNSFSQTLLFPIQDEDGVVKVANLNFKYRFKVRELSREVEGINPNNPIELTVSFVSALSCISRPLVLSMDYSDYKISSAVASFFI